MSNLCSACEPYETEEIVNCKKENCMYKKAIDGVGQDAEIVVNEKGGKQSKAIAAIHLIDPTFLKVWYSGADVVINFIADFMIEGNKDNLIKAIFEINAFKNIDKHENTALLEIGKVLQYGAERYVPNNWRLIPQEEHINHALIHYIAYQIGDRQDEHLEHCMCRLMMAHATEKSESFEYGAYVG